jgi:hypothetical protein
MRLTTLLTIGLGAAAGYAAVRVLLETEALPEQTPGPLREPLERVAARLRRARARVSAAIDEANEERAEAERELHAAYLERVGRS